MYENIVLLEVLYLFIVIRTYESIVRCLFSIDKIALEVALKLPSK